MPGRQQHYLPQFIQRPFAFRQKGRNFYVHAHHRTNGRFSPSTNGIGKELDFYSGPNDPALDDEITRRETNLSSTINAINNNLRSDPAELATLLCSIGMRTKAMRAALAGLLPPLLKVLRSNLLNINTLRDNLRSSLNDPELKRKAIKEELEKALPNASREVRSRMKMVLQLQWRSYVERELLSLTAAAWSIARSILDTADREATSIADQAFLSALSADPDMPLRANRITQDMVFEVIEPEDKAHFVLGDCGPIAIYSDGKPRLAFGALDSSIEMRAIYLPTSPTRCLVARARGFESTLSRTDINRLSASLSLEFFISIDESSPELEGLRGIIGTLAPIEGSDQILQIIEGAIK